MVAKSLKWALAGLIVFPTAALALGLGDIHLKSTLDAPLDANIEILGATADQMANLKPKIASRDVFEQHGLDWSPFLADVTIRAVHRPNGQNVLELRSVRPVTEPFLTLLVELDWDRGHFVREYTVLLDPPVYTPNGGRVARESVEAPTTGAASNEGTIQRAPACGRGRSGARPQPLRRLRRLRRPPLRPRPPRLHRARPRRRRRPRPHRAPRAKRVPPRRAPTTCTAATRSPPSHSSSPARASRIASAG